jgi:hypothetical protein
MLRDDPGVVDRVAGNVATVMSGGVCRRPMALREGECDSMDFGLLCYEAGRVAGRAELDRALRDMVFEETVRRDRRGRTTALDRLGLATALARARAALGLEPERGGVGG